MSMNISLPPNLEKMVKKKVEMGLYASASEVIREALRLLEREELLFEHKLNQLKTLIHEGLDSESIGHLDMKSIKAKARLKE